ncbi:hypothetical protein APY03_2303 [Variovorax sp. WDL1]|nr:hypothetical protein APY03_2303 [Variovorax sp. WDL1]
MRSPARTAIAQHDAEPVVDFARSDALAFFVFTFINTSD